MILSKSLVQLQGLNVKDLKNIILFLAKDKKKMKILNLIFLWICSSFPSQKDGKLIGINRISFSNNFIELINFGYLKQNLSDIFLLEIGNFNSKQIVIGQLKLVLELYPKQKASLFWGSDKLGNELKADGKTTTFPLDDDSGTYAVILYKSKNFSLYLLTVFFFSLMTKYNFFHVFSVGKFNQTHTIQYNDIKKDDIVDEIVYTGLGETLNNSFKKLNWKGPALFRKKGDIIREIY